MAKKRITERERERAKERDTRDVHEICAHFVFGPLNNRERRSTRGITRVRVGEDFST